MLRTCTRSCRPGQRPLVVEMILSIPEEPTVGCDLNFKVKLWEKKKKKGCCPFEMIYHLLTDNFYPITSKRVWIILFTFKNNQEAKNVFVCFFLFKDRTDVISKIL